MRITKKQKQAILHKNLDGKLDLILEQNKELLKLPPKFDKLAEDMEIVKSDIVILKIGQKNMQEDINVIKSDVDVMKGDINVIKHDLKQKIDREEFKTLERRVSVLEAQR